MLGINEFIFVSSIFFILFFLLFALRTGKEALVSLIGLQWVLANLLVTKQIVLFGFAVTGSDALAIGATLGLNLVQEYYGAVLARKTIFISFGALLFYLGITSLFIRYVPHPADLFHGHFVALFSSVPRLVGASLIAFLVSQYLEYRLYGLVTWLFSRRVFLLRNYLSVMISQFVDTILFTFLGLYGLVVSVSDIIVVSYTLKLITLGLAGPFLSVARKWFYENKL